jgi:hypothetical protein
MTETTPDTCVSCGRGEAEVPVLAWRYQGQPLWICSDCLPKLIHRRAELIAGLEVGGQELEVGSQRSEAGESTVDGET